MNPGTSTDVWWHVYPLGFCGVLGNDLDANPAATHAGQAPLLRLVGWLDHAVDLGATGVLLGPVFHASSHGYDTIDYFRIDPRLGTNNDFATLIDQVHARGLKICLDGVFNHVGYEFPAFQALRNEGPDSPTAGMFTLYWDEWKPGDLPKYNMFEGHWQLPELNHTSTDVRNLVDEVMRFWCAQGVDAWRLDAAYAVDPDFWAGILPGLRRDFPDVYVFGEVIHGDYVDIVQRSHMDSLTEYELWKAIWSSIENLNFFELEWTLGRHEVFTQSFVPQTFISNHDVTRIASQVPFENLPHATALLLLLPGTPSIYYGDEFALRGVKEERPGGDDAVRPAFPASPSDFIAEGESLEILRLYKDLIAFRRQRPWLWDAVCRVEQVSNEQLLLVLQERQTEDGLRPRKIMLALNIGEEASFVAYGSTENLVKILAGEGAGEVLDNLSRIDMSAHSWMILENTRI
ncbi:MAG: alpha-amylase family glycosyl hydrolase [Actinomycetaceae bacterium]|nr:alpha-amylase family glycosyl hydrolase [Actinomycetaceae bacterium]